MSENNSQISLEESSSSEVSDSEFLLSKQNLEDSDSEFLLSNQKSEDSDSELLLSKQTSEDSNKELLLSKQKLEDSDSEFLLSKQKSEDSDSELLLSNQKSEDSDSELLLSKQESEDSDSELLLSKQKFYIHKSVLEPNTPWDRVVQTVYNMGDTDGTSILDKLKDLDDFLDTFASKEPTQTDENKKSKHSQKKHPLPEKKQPLSEKKQSHKRGKGHKTPVIQREKKLAESKSQLFHREIQHLTCTIKYHDIDELEEPELICKDLLKLQDVITIFLQSFTQVKNTLEEEKKRVEYSHFQILPNRFIKCNVCGDKSPDMNSISALLRHRISILHTRMLQGTHKHATTSQLYCSMCHILVPDIDNMFLQHVYSSEHNIHIKNHKLSKKTLLRPSFP